MRLFKTAFIAPAFLCLSSLPVLAQYTVKRVAFIGKTPYSDADLQTVSGLRPGLDFTKDGLQAAAQKLIDTGAFDDVQVALDGPIKTITVNFTLKPVTPDHLLKVSFANLVWWQPEELQSALHAKVPLFDGTLPEAGNQQQAALDALKQLLTEKGVAAEINSAVIEPTLTQPYRLVEYTVTKPSVNLHAATITGASPNFASAIGKLTASIAGRAYNEGLTNFSFTEHVLDVYRDAGNLDAALTSEHRTLSSPAPERIDIDFTAAIDEGHPYRVSSIDFTPTPLMTSGDFTQSLKLHPEDIASRKALLESLKPLNDAYRSQGFLDATVQAIPTLDNATRHVTYAVSVTPGEQYRVRSVKALNLTPEQQKDFDRGWTLKAGSLYNESYVSHFLANNSALLSLANCSASYKTSADPEAHVVDVVMTFFQGKPSQTQKK